MMQCIYIVYTGIAVELRMVILEYTDLISLTLTSTLITNRHSEIPLLLQTSAGNY